MLIVARNAPVEIVVDLAEAGTAGLSVAEERSRLHVYFAVVPVTGIAR